MTALLVDGQRVEAQGGDSLLIAMLRTGLHPTGGGCLCLGGDCPNCLVTVDGVAYTRSCQVRAEAGMVVRRDHAGDEAPPLLSDQAGSPSRGRAPDAGKDADAPGVQRATPLASPARSAAPVRHVHCDTVVIGQGESGREAAQEAREAGFDVVTLDAREGQHVTGVYPGPLVVAANGGGRVLHVHPRREIVVATGAAEIQPVVPGSDLEGLVTVRAAAELAAAGIDLGRVVFLGEARLEAGAAPPATQAPGARQPIHGDSRSHAGRSDRQAGASEQHLPLGEGGWELVRFEGDGRVEAVVLRRHGDAGATEERIECDTAILDLGRNPRNALARMASDLPVRVVGSAAMEPELPPCPGEGTVCPCSGVTVTDLDGVWERGFHEMELLKRATLAGTGACQGGVCLPYLRSFLLERGGRLQPAFTARPLNRQLTVRELAAGAHTAVTARSPLHDEHLRLGARMDRAGGWWRPWTYGLTQTEVDHMFTVGSVRDDWVPAFAPWTHGLSEAEHLEFMQFDRRFEFDEWEEDEYDEPKDAAERRPDRPRPRVEDDSGEEWDAVRNSVSLGDVSPLGKMVIAGPDALPFLERIAPSRVATLGPGRCRYVVMLDERGYLFDDGMLCRDKTPDGADRFFLTSTSGGSSFLELWLRDWAEAFGFDVRIMNRTSSLAAINVTGPKAGLLLIRAGARELPGFGRHQQLRIAGIECRVVRLSFTGELSYELHHAAADAVDLWRRLLAVGGELGIRPHGLETLLHLRLEKGHFVVGHDTDYDSTPRRLGSEWAVDLDKGDFVGRQAIIRTNKQPPDRRLAGFVVDGPVDFDPPRPTIDPLHDPLLDPWNDRTSKWTLEGCAIYDGDRYAGYVTSAPASLRSDGFGRALARAELRPVRRPEKEFLLGWLDLDEDGNLPQEVTIQGAASRRFDGPFHDPGGDRARAAVDLQSESAAKIRTFPAVEPTPTDTGAEAPVGPPRLRPLDAARVVAAPASLDALVAQSPWPKAALALRLASDELLVTAAPAFAVPGDAHGIVERETAFSYVWLDEASAENFLDRVCEWERPVTRPALAQGEVAGIPAKLWLETGRTLIIVPAPLAAAFQRRMDRLLADAARSEP